MKRPRVGIIRRVAAEAVGAGELGPAPAIADRAQQALETFRSSARAGIAAAHVVNHDRQAQRFQNRNRLRQILHVDPELKMPAELDHFRRERLRYR
jgi:hypothetical protein